MAYLFRALQLIGAALFLLVAAIMLQHLLLGQAWPGYVRPVNWVGVFYCAVWALAGISIFFDREWSLALGYVAAGIAVLHGIIQRVGESSDVAHESYRSLIYIIGGLVLLACLRGISAIHRRLDARWDRDSGFGGRAAA